MVEKFTRLVSRSLEDGHEVRLEAGGSFAALQALRALAGGPGGAEFEVSWAEPVQGEDARDEEEDVREDVERPGAAAASGSGPAGADDGGGGGGGGGPTPSSSSGSRPPRLQLLARKCAGGKAAAEAATVAAAAAGLVTATTPTERLVRRLSLELAREGEALAQLRADAPTGASTLLAALAAAPDLGSGWPLSCTVARAPTGPQAGTPGRLVIRARDPRGGPREGDFRAFPLGSGGSGGSGGEAAAAAQARLVRAVGARLALGQAVVMECRGKDAVLSALAALGHAQGCTAEVEVHWVDDSSSAGGDRGRSGGGGSSGAPLPEAVRSLRLRALPGRPWLEFNSTDFSRTRLLKVSEASRARPLAAAVGSEVRKLGAVAVHAFADDKAAVSTALKALALVPQEHGGQRIFFVPSFGHVKRGSALRLYVRPLSRLSGAGGPSE